MPQRRDAPRSADSVAKGQRDEAAGERCPFVTGQELDAGADRAAERPVLPPRAALPVRQRVARQASQELAQRPGLERLRRQVRALAEPQLERAWRVRLVLQSAEERERRQVFLMQLWQRRPSLLFQPWSSLQRRLLLALGLESQRELLRRRRRESSWNASFFP